MMFNKFLIALLFAVVTASGVTFADDTELYVFESSARTGVRPKVLIIFDNSGSMDTYENVPDPDYIPPPGYDSDYDPSYDYSGDGFKDIVYFSKGVNSEPPALGSDSRFYTKYNGCHQSWHLLAQFGTFKGHVSEYRSKNKTGTWQELRTNRSLSQSRIIECWEDIEIEDPINSSDYGTAGFPVDGKRENKKNIPYNHVSSASDAAWDGALAAAKQTKIGQGESVTLYTDNYLRWYEQTQAGDIPQVSKKRIDIAKKAISDVINTTPSIDFGLAVFNNNSNGYDRDGGRIVAGITDMTVGTVDGDSARDSILTKINSLDAETWTPLCETLVEAHQYFAGATVKFGHKDSSSPAYDIKAEVEGGGTYDSPLKICPDIAYVIYVTDGAPSNDSDANGYVQTLTSGADPLGDYSAYYARTYNGWADSYMPALASYMFQNDLVDKEDRNGDNPMQTVRTFTIGFSSGADDAAPLLIETAKRGGGKYFAAQDSLELSSALSDALSSILEIDSSFTSPSIASNNFDRTQTFDAAYYAMFLPGKGPRWSGNLKKLKVTSGGTLVDKNNNNAIADSGNIKPTACTYWSKCTSGSDGNKVEEGGVAETMRAMSERNIISNTGSGGALEALSVSNAAGGDLAGLAAYMNTTESEVAKSIAWLEGVDVDDENENQNSTEIRNDIMGDPLHSKPLAINFGTPASPDIRIVLGTNQGLLHMFQDNDSSVTESWAFLPYELLPNVTKLRDNLSSGGHSIYGMDASPVAYVKTGSGGVEQAWVFAGMRRGGSSYYGVNITSPDNPSLMWKIDPDSDGFAELGQSWSEPVVTFIPGNDDPVLIIGGGYDVTYDTTPNSSPLGRTVYIVDAKTGSLIHTFGAGSGSGITPLPGISDSIPNSVAVLDSNSDGATDRIYATDTGGNVWRMDLPSSDKTTWTAFKFASLGGGTAANDRRFFAEPVVAQTVFSNISEVTVTESTPEGDSSTTTKTYQNVPYDAVSVGSGNRPNPTSTATEDMYYVLQDRNVITRSFDGSENPIPATIALNDLYNVTSKAPDTDSENIAFGKKLGWYYDFTGSGEKSLTAGLIVDGKVYFTSYVPPTEELSDELCTVSGEGRLYVFDLHKGTRTHDTLFYELGERVPDTPQIVIPAPDSGEDPYIYIIGVGKGEKGADGEYTGTINVGAGLGVNKIYYHIDE
ncbi:pilus assembly protein [Shewanella waksmanii]|uniref:pilus assembly protein n=1 Tax=Shewanella waksmanii TaxID=213783 RepID=UPI003CCB7652